MKIQNIENDPQLYLVPTPIGNFADMTFRSIEILNMVDMIFCEDTRVTKILLSHFNIKTPLSSYHIFNEESRVTEILENLKLGKKIALVSDAGLPCISDPGYLLVRRVLDEGYYVSSLPGANAGLTALIASGLPTDKFYFYGFLNHKKTQKEKELLAIRDVKDTIIFYESPLRLKDTVLLMERILGDREVVIARELTKKYEEYIRGTLKEIAQLDLQLKGEIVIIVKGANQTYLQMDLNKQTVEQHFNHYIDEGIEEKEAMKLVARDRNISKSEIYKQIKSKTK
ncbi:MAG TPA: 16S rRNA (cytidine(1402)-2'-O)-methyltransferase [Bacilli bacterium]|jgi:16S rRNA (cytidine1402-2'-O)-methyltransferase|nr:16S rRNA (cytidine(1402)-2'-O)-methyltransferase [Bacilli bacterium]